MREENEMIDGLFYFAHPYDSTDNTPAKNYQLCNQRAVKLIDLGYMIFSPITHSHPLHVIKKHPSEFWMSIDRLIMPMCMGLILAPRWKESRGCKEEYEYFKSIGRMILFYEDLIK